MELNAYSAARRDEAVRASPAAVYVLTGEDIRRARVTSVPEALRLVPGVVERGGGTVTLTSTTDSATPRHALAWRTEWDANPDVEVDAIVRYVGALPTAPVTLDLGLGWRIARGIDMSFVGQNLLDSHHREQPTGSISSTTEVQRGVYARLNWRF